MDQPRDTLQESIARQRAMLTELLKKPLQDVAAEAARVWPDRERLDAVLQAALPKEHQQGRAHHRRLPP